MAAKENHRDIVSLLESKMIAATSASSVGDQNVLSVASSSTTTVSCAKKSSSSLEDEVFGGLRAQDLQEAKEQLLVEISDLLHVPLFTAEALLRFTEWSRESLLDKWVREGPIVTCQMAGVQPPPYNSLQLQQQHHRHNQRMLGTRGSFTGGGGGSRGVGCKPQSQSSTQVIKKAAYQQQKMIHSVGSFIVDETLAEDEMLCEICCDLMSLDRSGEADLSCGHTFCSSCLRNHLHNRIVSEGGGGSFVCPAVDCQARIPPKVAEKYVSPALAKNYLNSRNSFAAEAANSSRKWCPYPGCQRSVSLPDSERLSPRQPAVNGRNALKTLTGLFQVPSVSHSVDCGGWHYFCYECGGQAHAPLVCGLWQQWREITRLDPNHLLDPYLSWLVTNTRPCPGCQAPVRKVDGCNKVTCSHCRYEFCWVCLEGWKKHGGSSAYFRCNRFGGVAGITSTGYVARMTSAASEADGVPGEEKRSEALKVLEAGRLSHYVTRYKNHENSCSVEEPLLHSAKQKREILQYSLTVEEVSGSGNHNSPSLESTSRRSSAANLVDYAIQVTPSSGNFYNEGIWELLKARRILCGSYAYGYFLDIEASGIVPPSSVSGSSSNSPKGILCPSKTIFEFMQNELEQVVESLSEMMSRPYLRTPKKVIVQTTQLCRQKRKEFLMGTYRGLVPPDVPVTSTCSKHHSQLLQLPPATNRLIDRRHSDRAPQVLISDHQTAVADETSQLGDDGKSDNKDSTSDDPWKPASNSRCIRRGCSNLCAAAQSATISRKFNVSEFCSSKCSSYYSRQHQHSGGSHHQRRESQRSHNHPHHNHHISHHHQVTESSQQNHRQKPHHPVSADKRIDKSFTLPRSSKSDDNILRVTKDDNCAENGTLIMNRYGH